MREIALSSAERVAMSRLKALLELLPATLDKQMARVGLTSFEFTLLEALDGAADHRLRLSALASRTNATLPRLSRVVTGLESKGLVVRSACSEDGRATNAVLTDAGVARHSMAKPMYEEAIRSRVLADLNGDDVADLSRLAYLILARLDPDHRRTTRVGDGSMAAADVVDCPTDVATVPAETQRRTGALPAAPITDENPADCPADPLSGL